MQTSVICIFHQEFKITKIYENTVKLRSSLYIGTKIKINVLKKNEGGSLYFFF